MAHIFRDAGPPHVRLANCKVVAYSLRREGGTTENVDILRITQTDNRYTVREQLRRTTAKQVLLVLPWEVEKGWDLLLDFEVLQRPIFERDLNTAWVVQDPDKRPIPKEAGFPVFESQAAAQAYLQENGTFPPLKIAAPPEQPKRPWWREEPQPPELPMPRPRPKWLLPVELGILAAVLLAVGITAFLSLPSATIRLTPQGSTYNVIVPISVDSTRETGDVDLQQALVPSRRVGDEFEGYAEVNTTGMGISFSGRSKGSVIFTNLLGQEYRVPKGTVVRTSAGSYPVRFQTTAEGTIPPSGQATVPVEATEEGPRGNVAAYQINFVEGVAGFALKVTNPDPITGAESEEVTTVSEADKARVWELASQEAMAAANTGLQDPSYLEAGEFLPRQPLVIQSVPREAYTKLIGEQAPTLGLTLRLLITGEAVNAADVQAVAYSKLATRLPEGYTLTDARFEYGESAEEDVGPGRFTFYVTAYGYATANIDRDAVWEMIRGRSAKKAETLLAESLPLAAPPDVTVEPGWFPFIPRLPIRANIELVPGTW